MYTFSLAVFFILVALLLVLVVLVQRGRGGGLSGAFGAGGGATAAFGTKTGDVFTTLTVILFVVFMLLAIWLNFTLRDPVAAPTPPVAKGTPSPLDMVDTSMPAAVPPATTLPATPASAPASQPK